MEKDLISIIVPIYKVREDFLRQCVGSIVSQTYNSLEIILVDDGSPDNCGFICDELAQKDSRIKVVHKENGGLSAARNTGVDNSTGRWIMFVDGDDWISPNMCESMYNVAVRDNVQLVMCGMVKEYGSTSEPYTYYLKEKVYRGNDCKWLQEQLLNFNGNIATAYCKLFLREFLINEGINHDPDLRQGAEGIEFNLRVFEKISSVSFINRSYYHYTYNEDSISAKHDEKNHKYVLKCFEKIKTLIDTSSNKKELMKWFNNRLLYVIITTAISGYFSPSNDEPFKDKKRKFKEFLKNPNIQTAMKTNNLEGLSKQRKIVLWLIKHEQFWTLNILGRIRKIQKAKK